MSQSKKEPPSEPIFALDSAPSAAVEAMEKEFGESQGKFGRLILLLRQGYYRNVAAPLAGIRRQTLTQWEDLAKAEKEPFASYIAELEVAESHFEAKMVDIIAKNAEAGKTGFRLHGFSSANAPNSGL
jgi:hypothetical protein